MSNLLMELSDEEQQYQASLDEIQMQQEFDKEFDKIHQLLKIIKELSKNYGTFLFESTTTLELFQFLHKNNNNNNDNSDSD